jgi:hypothetical protein
MPTIPVGTDVLGQVEAEVLVERILVALEEALDERLVDDRDILAVVVVGAVEVPASHQSDPQVLEIVRADPIPGRAGLLSRLRRRMSRHEHELAPVVGQRVVQRQTCAPYAREACEPLLDDAIQGLELFGGVGGGRPVQLHQDSPLNLEAEVLALEIAQAAREHHRTSDEDHGDRRLHDQQGLARDRRMIASAPPGPAEGVHRARARRKPRRRGTEQRAGDERDGHRETEHHRRGARVDRQERRSGERQRQQEARRAECDCEAGDPAGKGQQDALDERLDDDVAARRADREPDRGLAAPGDRAGEQQVGDVGARDEQHQPAHAKQKLQAAPVLLLHDPDAGAGGHHVDHLARQCLDHVRHPVGGIARIVLHPLVQDAGEPRADAVDRGVRPNPADHAQPGRNRLLEDGRVAVDERLLLERNPQIGRIASQRLAEEPGRRHADDREGVSFDDQGRANERGIAAVGALPRVVAHHDGGSRRRRVVGSREHAATQRLDAERREVIASDVFRPQRRRARFHALAPHTDPGAAGLERREFLELGQVRLQALEQWIREHAPAILRTTLDAAAVAVADPIEPRGIADRQRSQHDRVDEREDRRRAADAERQRQNRGDGEDARDPKLAQGVADFTDEAAQSVLLSIDSRATTGLDGQPQQIVAGRSDGWLPPSGGRMRLPLREGRAHFKSLA